MTNGSTLSVPKAYNLSPQNSSRYTVSSECSLSTTSHTKSDINYTISPRKKYLRRKRKVIEYIPEKRCCSDELPILNILGVSSSKMSVCDIPKPKVDKYAIPTNSEVKMNRRRRIRQNFQKSSNCSKASL